MRTTEELLKDAEVYKKYPIIAELSAKLRASEVMLYITRQGLESERETSRQYKTGWDEAERKLKEN